MYRMQIRTFFQPFLSYIKSCKEKKSSIAEKRIKINLNYMWPLQEKFYLEFLYSGNLILVHSNCVCLCIMKLTVSIILVWCKNQNTYSISELHFSYFYSTVLSSSSIERRRINVFLKKIWKEITIMGCCCESRLSTDDLKILAWGCCINVGTPTPKSVVVLLDPLLPLVDVNMEAFKAMISEFEPPRPPADEAAAAAAAEPLTKVEQWDRMMFPWDMELGITPGWG